VIFGAIGSGREATVSSGISPETPTSSSRFRATRSAPAAHCESWVTTKLTALIITIRTSSQSSFHRVHLQSATISLPPTIRSNVVSRTDCVRDRLASFYFFGDRSALAASIAVAQNGPVKLSSIRRWSEREGEASRFAEFYQSLQAAKAAQKFQ
jgi:hypothetical protein